MIMPLWDENRPGEGPPVVTWLLIAVNILVFLLELALGEPFINGYSVVPAEITQHKDLVGPQEILIDETERVVIEESKGPPLIYLTLFTSMFMHGSLLHLGGNMLYLWIFGDNVELSMGRLKYFCFYLLCGLAATATHIASNPDSVIPSLGASGAIAGVLGAYLVMFPTNPVRVLVPRVGIFPVPAVLVLGMWFVLQLIPGIGTLTTTAQSAGVAYWAHIGGFVAGMGLVFLFRKRKRYQYT